MAPRAQPYRLDLSSVQTFEDLKARLPTIVDNADQMFQYLFEDLKAVANSVPVASSSSSGSGGVSKGLAQFLSLNTEEPDDVGFFRPNPAIQELISTFTQGSVIFAGPSGTLTQDNAAFFWDDTNAKLDITGPTGLGLLLTQTGTGNVGIEFVRSGGTATDWIFYAKPASTSFVFSTGGSDKYTFDAAGLLSLGAVNASDFVEIGANAAASGAVRVPNNSVGFAARNALNTGDVVAVTVDAANNVLMGGPGAADIIFEPSNAEQFRAKTGAGLQMITTAAVYWNGRGVLLSPADAEITFTNNAQSKGVGFQCGTADTLIVANQAQNAYGTVDALQYKLSATVALTSTALTFPARSSISSTSNSLLTFTNNAGTSGFGLQMGTADTMIVANKAQNAYGSVDALQYKLSATTFVNSSGKIVNYNGVATVGEGVVALYGLDSRTGLTGADGAATTLYTAIAANNLFRVSADIFATAAVTGTATYSITWTENGTGQTMSVTATAVNTLGTASNIIRPDNGTAIKSQLTGVFTGTFTVAGVVEQLA